MKKIVILSVILFALGSPAFAHPMGGGGGGGGWGGGWHGGHGGGWGHHGYQYGWHGGYGGGFRWCRDAWGRVVPCYAGDED